MKNIMYTKWPWQKSVFTIKQTSSNEKLNKKIETRFNYDDFQVYFNRSFHCQCQGFMKCYFMKYQFW